MPYENLLPEENDQSLSPLKPCPQHGKICFHEDVMLYRLSGVVTPSLLRAAVAPGGAFIVDRLLRGNLVSDTDTHLRLPRKLDDSI